MDTIIGETIRDIIKANAFAKKRAFDLIKANPTLLGATFQEFDDKTMINIRIRIESLLPKEKMENENYNQALKDVKKIIKELE
jgi:hypothetical protein